MNFIIARDQEMTTMIVIDDRKKTSLFTSFEKFIMSSPTKRNVSYNVFFYLIEVKITADEYTKESHVIKITLNRFQSRII